MLTVFRLITLLLVAGEPRRSTFGRGEPHR